MPSRGETPARWRGCSSACRGDPRGRPPRGHAKRTCKEDMCCGDSRPVSPQATLFSEISSCRNHHILLSSRYFSTGFLTDCFPTGCFPTGCLFNKHGRLRRRRASKARNTCPPGISSWHVPVCGRPQGSPLRSRCSPPSGTCVCRMSTLPEVAAGGGIRENPCLSVAF